VGGAAAVEAAAPCSSSQPATTATDAIPLPLSAALQPIPLAPAPAAAAAVAPLTQQERSLHEELAAVAAMLEALLPRDSASSADQ